MSEGATSQERSAGRRGGDRRRRDRSGADRRRCCCCGARSSSAAGSSARECWPTRRSSSDAADALRDAQYAPVLAANRAAIETPFASSWKGAAKPDVMLVEFFDYACPYCKASNPSSTGCSRRIRGCASSIANCRSSAPTASTAARLSLEASKAGRFAQFHDALWEAGRPAPETIAAAAAGRRHPARRTHDPGDRSRAQAQFPARRAARRDRHAVVHRRQQGDEQRGRLRNAQAGHRRAPRKELNFTADETKNKGRDRHHRRRGPAEQVCRGRSVRLPIALRVARRSAS